MLRLGDDISFKYYDNSNILFRAIKLKPLVFEFIERTIVKGIYPNITIEHLPMPANINDIKKECETNYLAELIMKKSKGKRPPKKC